MFLRVLDATSVLLANFCEVKFCETPAAADLAPPVPQRVNGVSSAKGSNACAISTLGGSRPSAQLGSFTTPDRTTV